MSQKNNATFGGVKKPYNIKDGAVKVSSNIVIWLFCLSYIVPFVWLFYNTLKDRQQFAQDILSLPIPPTFENYINMFSDVEFYYALKNSLFNTCVSIVGALLLSFILGYFLSRYRFKGRNFLYLFFLLGMVVPVHALLIPIYIQFTQIGINNAFYTLIIPYITFAIPRDIYLFDSYITGIPRAIEEAAHIDGATRPQIMTKVIFPICAPISLTIVILDFISLWNEFLFALVLIDDVVLRTIPIWLTNFQSQYTTNVPARLTTMMLAMLPIIIMYVFFSERMMKGMVAGAVKG